MQFLKCLLLLMEKMFPWGNPLSKVPVLFLKVLEHGKDDKIIVFKYKPKKKYRRTYGHRQPYTKVSVETIAVNG